MKISVTKKQLQNIVREELESQIKEELEKDEELQELFGAGNALRRAGQAGLDKMRQFRNKFLGKDKQEPAAPQQEPAAPQQQPAAAVPTGAVPIFGGKDSLQQRMSNSIKSRLMQVVSSGKTGLQKADVPNIMNVFSTQIQQILKDLSGQMKLNGLTGKQIQEMLQVKEQAAPQQQSANTPQKQPVNQTAATTAAKNLKTGQGGRVAGQRGQIDVRRAVFGKLTQAFNDSGLNAAMQPQDFNKLSNDIIEKLIIPFLTQHLSSRGFNVTDKKAGRSAPAKNVQGTPKSVTLKEATPKKKR